MRSIVLALTAALLVVPAFSAQNTVEETCLVPGGDFDGGVCSSTATTPEGNTYSQCYYVRVSEPRLPFLVCMYPGDSDTFETCLWTNREIACDAGVVSLVLRTAIGVANTVIDLACDRLTEPC